MRRIAGKLQSMFLIVCLIASCVCFDSSRAVVLPRAQMTIENANSCITASDGIWNIDLCASEWLQSTSNVLLHWQTISDNNKQAGQFIATDWLQFNETQYQSLVQQADRRNLSIDLSRADTGQLLFYIHDKDGKKYI